MSAAPDLTLLHGMKKLLHGKIKSLLEQNILYRNDNGYTWYCLHHDITCKLLQKAIPDKLFSLSLQDIFPQNGHFGR